MHRSDVSVIFIQLFPRTTAFKRPPLGRHQDETPKLTLFSACRGRGMRALRLRQRPSEWLRKAGRRSQLYAHLRRHIPTPALSDASAIARNQESVQRFTAMAQPLRTWLKMRGYLPSCSPGSAHCKNHFATRPKAFSVPKNSAGWPGARPRTLRPRRAR